MRLYVYIITILYIGVALQASRLIFVQLSRGISIALQMELIFRNLLQLPVEGFLDNTDTEAYDKDDDNRKGDNNT